MYNGQMANSRAAVCVVGIATYRIATVQLADHRKRIGFHAGVSR